MSIAVDRLVGLAAVVVVALLGLVYLLRGGGRPLDVDAPTVRGYPLDRYPARRLTATGPLAALATTQARLLAMYANVSPGSDAAIWLMTFLRELREIMDTAYRVAVATEPYGSPTALERLVAEVEDAEREVAGQVVRRLLLRDGDADAELLAGRLATLRLCVRELSTLTGA